MSILDTKDSIQYRYHELEKKLQALENQNNLLKYELDQKNQVLAQVTKELSQNRIQYKESVDKIAELSIKKAEKNSNNYDQIFYDNQINNQAHCIDYLHDRLWSSEYLSRLNNHYSNQNENIQRYINYQNFLDEQKQKTDKKIIYYEKCINQYKKEIKKWKSFAIRIFDISSEVLEIEQEFPKHDSRIQRQITVELVEQLAKQKVDDTQLQRKYQLLQNKYNSLSQYLNKVKYRCNCLTEKTQNHLNIDSFDHDGEISRIEEFVTQKNYFKEPESLRNSRKKKKAFNLDIGNEDFFIGNDKAQTENDSSKNYSEKYSVQTSSNDSIRNNSAGSSLSSFDNSFESIKNLVKSFSREIKNEKKSRSRSKSKIKASTKKGTSTQNVDDFSFESN